MNKFTLFFCCDTWWAALRDAGYEIDFLKDDVANQLRRQSYRVPNIGERLSLEGCPFDWALSDLTEQIKEDLKKAFEGEYRVVDLCEYVEFADPKEYPNEEMYGSIDVVLKKISDHRIFNSPTGEYYSEAVDFEKVE
jgi:hypothetical protein